mgnify:CR=1 FL=1
MMNKLWGTDEFYVYTSGLLSYNDRNRMNRQGFDTDAFKEIINIVEEHSKQCKNSKISDIWSGR